ncbi:hypothetical protein HDE_13485 [Halotydeus destructor]|nr:hypothetical protein HDE_13485 [Halotydeus destructor]
MNYSKSALILRQISSELRQALGQKASLTKNDSMRYILSEARRHDVTQQRICRPEKQMQMLAKAYYHYLNSNRLYKQLYQQYHGKEKTVEQTAQMVGFALPEKKVF